MRWAALLFAIWASIMPGCGSSPAPKSDPVEYDRQMKNLNEEVLRQEGKLKHHKP